MLLAEQPLETEKSAPVESTGMLLRSLVLLALPVFIEQMLHACSGLGDTYIANHVIRLTAGMSAQEVLDAQRHNTASGAAVGTIVYLLWFVGLVAGAVGTGSTAIIARATGARHRSLANSICGQSISLAAIVGVVLGVGVHLLAGPIAGSMGLQGESVALAERFLGIVAIGVPFLLILLVANACLRGAGDTISPALAMVTVDCVNILTSFTLTFGWFGIPAMGFMGIAYGATAGYVVGGVMQAVVLIIGRGGVRLHLHRLQPHWHNLKRLLRIGLPSGAESFVMWIVNIILVRVVNGMDASGASGAAHAIAVRVEAFSYLSGFAIAIAATTMVGQSLGMKNPTRAGRAAYLAYRVGGTIMAVGGLLLVLFGRFFAGAMSADPTVSDLTTKCLFYAGFIQPAFAAAIIFGGSLRGAGDTLRVMTINIVSMVGIRLVGVAIATQVFHVSLPTIWILLCIDLIVRGLCMFVRFRHGGWKMLRV